MVDNTVIRSANLNSKSFGAFDTDKFNQNDIYDDTISN